MGLMQRPVQEVQAEDDKKVIQVLETVKIPVQTAAKRFYAENPQEFLQWITLSVVLVLVIIISLLRPFPAVFYILILGYVICQSLMSGLNHGIIKKITKKKK